MIRAAPAVLAMMLTACMGTGPEQAGPAAAPGPVCNARPALRLVGTAFEPSVADQAMRVAGARTVRVIRPGQAVTMDYREDRLNIEIDDQGRVAAVRCG